MSKIDLKPKELITIMWRTLIVVLLTLNLIFTVTTNKQVIASTNVIVSNVKNTYDAVIAQSNSQPEIPEENNQDYQASCPSSPDFYDNPGKMIEFLNAVDPILSEKPYLMNVLIAMLVTDKQDVVNYLENRYSGGFPNP